ncbi:MOP flippase family protein [Candidatus Neomarinimicrobiota bacterium]
MYLRESVISGTKWSAVSQFGRQGIQIVTLVILARLLAPEDFGLVGMTTVVIGFLAIFKDLGTSAAVIQRQDLSEELLSSVFWLNVLFGLVVMALLYAASPLVAAFYQESRVVPLLQVLSATFFISGLSILHQTLLERDMAFNRMAKVELSATVVGAIVGIGAALSGWGVWSLVFQSLAIALVTTVLLWVFSSWRPRWIFRWDNLRSVARYSLNLLGFNIINYLARNAPYLLIGRFLGAEALGYYTLAYKIILYPLQNISYLLARVMFPAFSRLQKQLERFRRSYLRVAASIALVTFPLMMGLMALAAPFVLAILGEKWEPVIILLIILAPVGLAQSIRSTVGVIYLTMGRTDWMFRWIAVAGSLIVISYVIGLRWGIVGVATAYAIISIFLIYPNYAIPFGLIDLRVRKVAKVLWRPLLSSLIMGAVLLLTRHLLLEQITSVQQLALLIPLGIMVYFAAIWGLDRPLLLEIWGMVRVKS